jgi:HEAT repeat protein
MGVEGSVGVQFNPLLNSDELYRLIGDTHPINPPGIRIDALNVLGNSRDPRAVRPIIECCGDENPEIRQTATRALGRLQSPRAVEALVVRLCDREELLETRKQAAMALAVIRGFSAIEGLKQVCLDDTDDPSLGAYAKEMLVYSEKK